MAEVTNELMYELLKRIHHGAVRAVGRTCRRSSTSSTLIRGHLVAVQSDIHNIYGMLAPARRSSRPDRTPSRTARTRRTPEAIRPDMKSAVVLLPGLNRDRDMIAALTKISGKPPVTVWQTDTEIPDVDLIVIPGGFSYGDYLRCGAIAARKPVMRAVAEKAAKGVHGDRRLQRLPDPARGRPAARRADAQPVAEIRLPRSEASGGQRQYRVHPQLCARPDHPRARRPSRRQLLRRCRDAGAARRRWPASCSAMPRAPIPTAR